MSDPVVSQAAPPEQQPTAKDRRRAMLRILLGLAQIMAATVGLVLLLTTGMALATLVAVGGAGLLVAASRILFRGK